jgi:hypothetical protein
VNIIAYVCLVYILGQFCLRSAFCGSAKVTNSCSVGGWLVGWLVGRSVGRSVKKLILMAVILSESDDA